MKVFVLVIALLGCAACHAPVTVTTPQGHIAYTADQIVVRVNALERAAIAANANGALPMETTRVIVTFCVDADKTLAATPAGWYQAVSVAWASAKTQLPPIGNPTIAAAVSSVDVVLASLGGGQ